MVGIIIIVVTVIILTMVFYNPKKGPVFLWAFLFLYPHYYMWQRQLLPLNIGIDDLYTIVFFLAVVLRRNLTGGVKPRLGFAFWVVFLFSAILVMTNANSYITLKGLEGDRFIKGALKAIINILLVYSLVNTIDDMEDLTRSIFAFCFFAGCGAVLVILDNYFPGPMNIFKTPGHVLLLQEGYETVRPSGAFLGSNEAALVMGCSSLIIVTTLKVKSMFFNKSLRVVFLGLSAVAVLMTLSRAGVFGLAAPLFLMCFFGKQKHFGILFLIISLAAIVLLPQVREMLFARFEAGRAGLGFWMSLSQRYISGTELWHNITFSRLLFGLDHQADALLGNQYPHSLYQGLTLTYGIGGTIWTIWLVVLLYRKSKAMKNSTDSQISAFGSAIRWCLVNFAVFGIAAGIFDNPYGAYTLFLLVVIADRGFDFMYSSEPLYYDEYYMEDQELTTGAEGVEELTEVFYDY